MSKPKLDLDSERDFSHVSENELAERIYRRFGTVGRQRERQSLKGRLQQHRERESVLQLVPEHLF